MPLSPPTKAFTPTEVFNILKQNNSFKALPGYNLIVGEILKHLPKKAIVLLITVYINKYAPVMLLPIQWKFAQIIFILKLGKAPIATSSYRPISLLPIMVKIFETLLLARLKQTIPTENRRPEHHSSKQFPQNM